MGVSNHQPAISSRSRWRSCPPAHSNSDPIANQFRRSRIVLPERRPSSKPKIRNSRTSWPAPRRSPLRRAQKGDHAVFLPSGFFPVVVQAPLTGARMRRINPRKTRQLRLATDIPITASTRVSADVSHRAALTPRLSAPRKRRVLAEECIMARMDGKVVFITGAGSGIARAASRLFAQEGARASSLPN